MSARAAFIILRCGGAVQTFGVGIIPRAWKMRERGLPAHRSVFCGVNFGSRAWSVANPAFAAARFGSRDNAN